MCNSYNGKSTGAGALSVWTRHLKEIEIKNWKDQHYSGKAFKLGAGVQGMEAYAAAHKHGLRMVGGECPTVGIAGGYSQGGGHSSLSSKHGLGADQVLEWEVIDGHGRFLVANRNQNPDLYWALSGGGGGTYGVVWSMTSKAHQDSHVSGFNLTFTTDGISDDTFYKALELYNTYLPSYVDQGIMSLNFLTNTSFGITPMTAPGIPLKKLEEIVQPFLSGLDKLGIKYQSHGEEFDAYIDQFNAQTPLVEIGVAQYGSWLIPRSTVEDRKSRHDLTKSLRTILSYGASFTTVGIKVTEDVTGDVYNAVNPAWRGAIAHVLMSTPWEFNKPAKMLQKRKLMTDVLVPSLSNLAPESGAYLNEV
jgi:hypothetical protein